MAVLSGLLSDGVSVPLRFMSLLLYPFYAIVECQDCVGRCMCGLELCPGKGSVTQVFAGQHGLFRWPYWPRVAPPVVWIVSPPV